MNWILLAKFSSDWYFFPAEIYFTLVHQGNYGEKQSEWPIIMTNIYVLFLQRQVRK